MHLFDLNADILSLAYSEWLMVEDLQKLDTALTNKNLRTALGQVFSQVHLTVGRVIISCERFSESVSVVNWTKSKLLNTRHIVLNLSSYKVDSKALTTKAVKLFGDLVKRNVTSLRSLDIINVSGDNVLKSLNRVLLPSLCLETLTLGVEVKYIDKCLFVDFARYCPLLTTLTISSEGCKSFPEELGGIPEFSLLHALCYEMDDDDSEEELVAALRAMLLKAPRLTSFRSESIAIDRDLVGAFPKLTHCRATFDDVDSFRDFLITCPTLTSLWSEFESDAWWEVLASHPCSIKELTISSDDEPEYSVAAVASTLSKLNCLEKMLIHGPEDEDWSVIPEVLARGSGLLKKFYFDSQGECNTEFVVSMVKANPGLESFEIQSPHVDADAIILCLASHCTSLRELNLLGVGRVSDSAMIELLTSCMRIEHLDLTEAGGLTDVVLPYLVALQNLVMLNLNAALLTNSGIALFANCQASHVWLWGVQEDRTEQVEGILEAIKAAKGASFEFNLM